MTCKLYAVRNVTTGIFDVPYPSMTDKEAKILFEKAIKDVTEKTDEEFDLWRVGSYNLTTGELEKEVQIERI